MDLEYVVCNLCGSQEYQVIFPDTRLQSHVEGRTARWSAFCCTHSGYGVHFQIVQCSSCKLVYANPRTPRQAVVDIYEAVEDPVYLEERAARELTFRRHLAKLEKFTGSGQGRRLLDIGAYIGVFVEEASKAGWDAWGLEPSRWGVSYATNRGLNVVKGLLSDRHFEPGSFDVVTMWDVFEHLGDPLGELHFIYELLRPGGWIAIHTMDIDSVFARWMGKRWPWLMEMHIYYFSARTLRDIVEKAGFEVKTIRAEGRYLRLNYLITRLRPYSPFLAGVAEGFAKLTGLSTLAIPINFGDLVTVYAQKVK